MYKNISRLLIHIFFFISTLFISLGNYTTTKKIIPLSTYIYGITIDDSWTGEKKLSQIIDSISSLSVKPTVRIVMSDEIPITEYKKIFKKIHKVAYIMASPVDSYYMKKYNIETYLKRFKDSYEVLSQYTDIWEIGNEVNGEEWLGKNPQLISDKIYVAYKFIYDKKAKTALTGYYFAPGEQKIPMEDWLIKYIPSDMKKNLNYVFVSYYEDDNNDYQPEWKKVFENLEKIFPNSKLGIGECGSNKYHSKKKLKMAKHYYSMPKYVKNYVGGYFWWYWVRDGIPHKNNKFWEEVNKNMSNF